MRLFGLMSSCLFGRADGASRFWCLFLPKGGEADEAVRAAAAGRSTLLAEVSDVHRDVLLQRLARSEAYTYTCMGIYTCACVCIY